MLCALFVSSEMLCSRYFQNVVISHCRPAILKVEDTCSISRLLSSAFEKCIHATILPADWIIIRGFVGKLDSDVRWRSIHENPSGVPEIGVINMSLLASVLARFWRLFASDKDAPVVLETICFASVSFHEFMVWIISFISHFQVFIYKIIISTQT